MRGLILILILLVVVAIAAIATGFLNIDQTRGAQVPQVSVTGDGVVAKGGQAPKFDVDTGNVKVVPPQIQVTPKQDGTAPAQAQPQPQPQRQAQPQQQAQPKAAPKPAAPSAPATTDSTQR
jgi:hypothetical protein